MSNFRITGKVPLKGRLVISGRKNAALKLIAATLLTDKPVTLRRLPDIQDVTSMLEILGQLGATITREDHMVTIDTSGVSLTTIPADLARKLRASLVLVGPLLARFGKAAFPHPGGCVLGKRSIRPHLDAFGQLGAQVDFDGTIYQVHSEALTGKEIYLKEATVTGTENLIMASVLAKGITTIYNCAREDHIVNLADLLRAMGYDISGDGTPTIVIRGSETLSSRSAEITIIPDEIEVGTYAVAAAVTGGDVTLEQIGTFAQVMPILSALDDFNVSYAYNRDEQTLRILPEQKLMAAPGDVKTMPWPGFPPDLQSPFTVLATQAVGTTLIHDWMYEGRLYFVDLLQKMGANIVICDPHRALVSGPTPLSKSSSITPDLRAGAALVIAALIAEGTSLIEHAEHIDRGYDDIVGKLSSLGAVIVRE